MGAISWYIIIAFFFCLRKISAIIAEISSACYFLVNSRIQIDGAGKIYCIYSQAEHMNVLFRWPLTNDRNDTSTIIVERFAVENVICIFLAPHAGIEGIRWSRPIYKRSIFFYMWILTECHGCLKTCERKMVILNWDMLQHLAASDELQTS